MKRVIHFRENRTVLHIRSYESRKIRGQEHNQVHLNWVLETGVSEVVVLSKKFTINNNDSCTSRKKINK